MGAHTFSLIHLDGAGMRLFFGDADLGKYVKDRLALYLKFSGQIVDSNLLLHPPLLFPPNLPSDAHVTSSREFR
jgi:hypothetical protein